MVGGFAFGREGGRSLGGGKELRRVLVWSKVLEGRARKG